MFCILFKFRTQFLSNKKNLFSCCRSGQVFYTFLVKPFTQFQPEQKKNLIEIDRKLSDNIYEQYSDWYWTWKTVDFSSPIVKTCFLLISFFFTLYYQKHRSAFKNVSFLLLKLLYAKFIRDINHECLWLI